MLLAIDVILFQNHGFARIYRIMRIIGSSFSSPHSFAVAISWIMQLVLFLEIDLGDAKTKSALIREIRENPRFRIQIMQLVLFLEIDLGDAKTKSALIREIRENLRFRQLSKIGN